MNPSSPPPFTIDQMDNFLTDNLSNTWYDWGDHLLDINFDQLDFTDDHHQFTLPDPPLPLDAPPIPQQPIATVVESDRGGSAVERVRKRDPRLTCENFLAGMVPCACPELDAQMAEEEELEKEGRGKLVKKRPRTAAAVVSLKCQVPVCEADISELKGYHKRHRVCLRCANASEVVLDGQSKRYCQQCGKFHILPDFDEGKRSCRRKLEHHNRRRRRKSTDLRGVVDREIQADQPAEDIAHDDKAGKDNSCLSNQIVVVDEGVDSEDGRVSPLPEHESSQNNSQNIQSDSGISFLTNSDAKTNGQKDSSHRTLSSSLGENRSSYSSLCPSGRISFKLYDWNPAEFPRRLRHQIFHWLKSMPVELEGYIRPGCTILTVFIAMPSSMWDKLSEDTSSYIHDFLVAPDSMLFGRGPMVIYLNDMIFQVPKGGPSLMNVKVELRSPRLHYVHPTCFEAGKPMEFVLCGSNLLQPKFRFLISFAGKYLAYDYCVAISRESRGLHSVSKDIAVSCEHMMYKIYIPNTDPKLFGPAFVEVENESGISNFIPVLIADRHVCSEMQAVQQRFPKSLSPKGHQHAVGDPLSDPCEGFALRQAAISELLLDVAWLLKEPQLEDVQPLSTSSQIQRFNCLLDFLIQNKLAIILEKILLSLKMVTDFGQLCKPDIETSYADLKLFENYVERDRQIVHQRCLDVTELHSENSVLKEDLSSLNDDVSETRYMPNDSEDTDMSEEKMVGATTNFQGSSEAAPLINREVIMNVNCRQQVTILPQNSWHRVHSTRFMRSRQFLLVAGVTAMCFGVCAVVIHPTKVGELAVSLRRCLFGTPDL